MYEHINHFEYSPHHHIIAEPRLLRATKSFVGSFPLAAFAEDYSNYT